MTACSNIDAVKTMEQEIESQLEVAGTVLRSLTEQVTSATKILQNTDCINILGAGIGDSFLISSLASTMLQELRQFKLWAAKSSSLSHQINLCESVIVHSISGATPVSVSFAKQARSRGKVVIAITDSDNSPLEAQSTFHIRVPIPRFPPDAKVPGTLTVCIPLATTLILMQTLDGGCFEYALTKVLRDISLAWADVKANSSDDKYFKKSEYVQVVYPPPFEPYAQYFQSKLAETTGINSSYEEIETWFHVAKHAVAPNVRVLLLGSETLEKEWILHLSNEIDARGGRLDILFDKNPSPEVLNNSYNVSLKNTNYQISIRRGFAILFQLQKYLLNSLRRDGIVAPFQLNRLTREQVKGLTTRRFL